MRDLISRYEAIEAIDKILPTGPIKNEYTKGYIVGAALALKYVMQLPSVQPEASLMTMKAILEPEEIEKVIYKTKDAPIMMLPPVQPEIIRCKNCKYYEGGWYCSAWNNSPGFPMVTEEGYCDLAERRTDG